MHAQICLHQDPARAIEAANAYVASHLPAGRFVSAWVGVFAPDGTVRFVDAGHGHWLVVAATGVRSGHEYGGGIPVGVDPDATYEVETLRLEPGDRIILYTDGLTEQTNVAGEQYGRDRLVECVREASAPGADVTHVFDAVRRFSGGTVFEDDATIGSIRYNG